MKQAVSVLRAVRTRKGLTQEALEAAANVSQATISGLESRGPGPAVQAALRIARALGMTVEELFAEDAAARRASTSVRTRRRAPADPAVRSRDSAA